MENNMFEQLKEIIKRVMPDLDVEGVTLKTKLIEDLKFDSLAFMAMAAEFEAEYGVEFEGPIQFKTVQDVMDFVQERESQKGE